MTMLAMTNGYARNDDTRNNRHSGTDGVLAREGHSMYNGRVKGQSMQVKAKRAVLCFSKLSRVIIISFLAVLVAPALNAAVFAPSLEGAEESVTASFTLFCGNMTDPYPHDGAVAAGGSVGYTLDAETLFASGALSFTSHTADVTGQIVYWPKWHPALNAGIGAVAHYKACEDAFGQADLLFGGWVRWRLLGFELNANVDYMLTQSRIHALDRYISPIVNNSMALGIEAKYHFGEAFCVWASIASWSESSFMLFFAPRLSLGAQVQVAKGRGVGIEATAVYIDMATLSGYCEGTEVRFFFRWTAKR